MSHKDGTECAFLRIWRMSVSFHNVDLGKMFALIGFNDHPKNIRGIAISVFGWTATLKYWVKTEKYSDGVTVDCPMPSLVSYRVDLFSIYTPKV